MRACKTAGGQPTSATKGGKGSASEVAQGWLTSALVDRPRVAGVGRCFVSNATKFGPTLTKAWVFNILSQVLNRVKVQLDHNVGKFEVIQYRAEYHQRWPILTVSWPISPRLGPSSDLGRNSPMLG